MGYQVTWESQVGTTAQRNEDHGAVALLNNGQDLFAFIADGVGTGRNSGDLAEQLADALLTKATAERQELSPQLVDAWLKQAHVALRAQAMRHERAWIRAAVSYLIAFFRHGRLVFTIHAGDCRIGSVDDDQQVRWHTTIHSLAIAQGCLDEASLRRAPTRNQLTRSFKCQRYCEPESTAWDDSLPSSKWILATDGHWAGRKKRGDPTGDDASSLSIWFDSSSEKICTLASNFSVKRMERSTI